MKDFKKYTDQARKEFVSEVSKYTVSDNLALRTKAHSLLIAFDQAVAKALIIDGVVVPKGTLCDCEAPLIRTGSNTNEYCGICDKDLN